MLYEVITFALADDLGQVELRFTEGTRVEPHPLIEPSGIGMADRHVVDGTAGQRSA